MKTIGVIGTAGRGVALTARDWGAMRAALSAYLPAFGRPVRLVSGGSAWADHLAVVAYLDGEVDELTIHLVGKQATRAAKVLQYYHKKFAETCGFDPGEQIRDAIKVGAKLTLEYGKNGKKAPDTQSYDPLFRRNSKVAKQADELLVFHWGQDPPVKGGSADTIRRWQLKHRDMSITYLNIAELRAKAAR